MKTNFNLNSNRSQPMSCASVAFVDLVLKFKNQYGVEYAV